MAGCGCPMAGNMSMKARMGPIPHINTSIVWAWVGPGSQRHGYGAGAPILTSESGGHINSPGIEACIAPVMAGDITVEALREAGIPPEDTGAAADLMQLAQSVADTGAGPAPGRMAGLVSRALAGRTAPRKLAARSLPAPESQGAALAGDQVLTQAAVFTAAAGVDGFPARPERRWR